MLWYAGLNNVPVGKLSFGTTILRLGFIARPFFISQIGYARRSLEGRYFMHFYWQHRRFSPHFIQLTSGSMIILLLFAIFLGYFHSVHAAGETAPGGPGTASFWTPSNNTFLGTAQNATSDVWFTGYNGVMGEVFYPTADMPNTTDLQFLVGDSGHNWVDEEKVATTSQTQLYDNHSLAWTVTNTATSGKYRFTKIIYTDPTRNSLISYTAGQATTVLSLGERAQGVAG
jgi:glucodextranase-like protein